MKFLTSHPVTAHLGFDKNVQEQNNIMMAFKPIVQCRNNEKAM